MSEAGNVIGLPTNPQRYLDNVSKQLRRYPVWIIYRLVPDGALLKKIPHCWRDVSLGEINAFNPRNHGTFEECHLAARNAGAWFGVGIVLLPNCGVFVVDADFRKSEGLAPFIEQLKMRYPTAWETSVSDQGWHGYYFGARPTNTREKDALEIYFENQFIAVTGKDMTPEQALADGNDLLSWLYRDSPAPVMSTAPVAIDEINYESDTQLIEAASKFIKGGDLLNLLLTPNPFDWSDTFARIVLAFASAKAKKIDAYNTMLAYPFVSQSEPKGGESRSAKLYRLMYGRRGGEWEKAVQYAAGKGRYDKVDRSTAPVFGKVEPPPKTTDIGGLQVPQVDHTPKAIKVSKKRRDPWLDALDEMIGNGLDADQCVSEFKRRGFEQDEDSIRLAHRVATKGMIVLSRGAPMDHARKFVEHECMWGNFNRLRHWRNEFWMWNSAYYKEVERDKIRAHAWNFLDSAVCPQYDKETELLVGYSRMTPLSGTVSQMLDALAAVAGSAPEIAPEWMTATAPITKGTDWVAFKNGLYHLARDVFLECNPHFFNTSATEIAFDPVAPAPTEWLRFLSTCWPDDQESIDCLQDWFGYLLSNEMKYDKILGIVGPKRSGKGTILRVLETIIGKGCVSTSMQQLGLPSGFGLENLVGASVAVVPDASLSGRTDSVVVTEALKSISGRDQISVGRKGKTALSLRLGVRFVLAANETLALQDRTGALASRMVFLQMSVSWLGREDLELGDRLVLEASAILNWSLAGLRRLTKRGRFVQPATGMVALKEAEKVGSHVISFVEEHYDIAGEEWWVTRDNLYVKWVGWHSANNLRVSSRDVFFKDLRAAYPHLRDYQPKLEDGKQHKSFRGLKEKIND